MDNLLTLTLEAHNPERNHHRHYEIAVGRDLLDDWTVSIRYGRAGQFGRMERFGGKDAEALQVLIRDRLRRRQSAMTRIGCQYGVTGIVVMADDCSDLEPVLWFPEASLTPFSMP